MAISFKSMMNSSPKPADSFNILVVAPDFANLATLSRMLLSLGYKVLTATTASEAIYIAQKRKDLHLMLTDVRLPDMNKYELLEKMKAVSDLPLVIMFDDDDELSKLGCLFKGAVSCIVKPPTMDSLKNLWLYAFTKKKDVALDIPQKGNNFHDEQQARSEGVDNHKERDGDDSKVIVKRRQVWTNELHQKFLRVVRLLGAKEARPKQITQLMSVPGLTKKHVASHLQKYRLSLKREQEEIENRNIRAAKLACYRPYQSSSASIFQGGFCQLPNINCTYTPYQPELVSHVPKDLNGLMPTRPSFVSSDNPINLDSSGNETSNNRYWQPAPRNQLDYTYFDVGYIGNESSSNKDFAADSGDLESFFREVFQERNNSSSVDDNGCQNITDFSVHHAMQQEEQHQPPPPPLPSSREQKGNSTMGELKPDVDQTPLLTLEDQQTGEGDELLKFAEEIFDDVDSKDFF